jgi:hypothetical protein
MQTTKNSSHSPQRGPAVRPVLSQAQNNTTLWIGHQKTGPTDHFAGQTFNCPAEGQLDNIQLYSSAVQNGGEIVLTLHEFDPASRTWGAPIGSSSVAIRKGEDERWVRFDLPPVFLRKDTTYGFRVHANDAFVGLGEAASGNRHPFTFGHEWNGDTFNQTGNYYSYFSLAFRVELRA